eukprot:6837850-Pyramimonas_sp.AAC.1
MGLGVHVVPERWHARIFDARVVGDRAGAASVIGLGLHMCFTRANPAALGPGFGIAHVLCLRFLPFFLSALTFLNAIVRRLATQRLGAALLRLLGFGSLGALPRRWPRRGASSQRRQIRC